MYVHFYTAFKNLKALEKGEMIGVWNKSEATSTDIHISLNTNEYSITKVASDTAFMVMKV